MTHAEGRVHDQEGTLVASFSVDAWSARWTVRPMDRPGGDPRMAL